jgi:hypothetical protein
MDACNPLLQAHPTWARDKHEGRGFPLRTPVSLRLLPPSRFVSRRPIWAGARGDNLLVGPGTPRVRNADKGPGPHFMHLARRFLRTEKSHRHSRQYHASLGPPQKTEKLNFQDQCSDSRHPTHSPTNALSAEVTGQSAAGTGVAVSVTKGGPSVIASNGRANQSNFGPTCRLVSSPKAGPGATVGTLNQGYPLLQYEDTVPVRRSLAARRTAPDPATWTAQGAPHGEKTRSIPGCTSWIGPPRGSTGPLYAQPGPPITVRDSQVSMPGPLDGVQIPPSKVRATTGSRDRGYPGISKGPVLTRVRPYPMRLRSPLRRRPAAAAWLVARDVSQRAGPDVRPLGRAVSAFIAERTHRLSTLLTGDVPPQHFMCPVHSAGRQC